MGCILLHLVVYNQLDTRVKQHAVRRKGISFSSLAEKRRLRQKIEPGTSRHLLEELVFVKDVLKLLHRRRPTSW